MAAPQTHWADSPFPLIKTPLGSTPKKGQHASVIMAHEMSHLHNSLIRSLNALYQQAPYVKEPRDITDLLSYARHWRSELLHHHDTEELAFFPTLETLLGEKGIMEGNIEQHHAFEPGLDALKAYLDTTTAETYKSEDLQKIILSFGPVLTTHLSDEITTLLSLKDRDSALLMKAWQATHNHAMKTADASVQLPVLMGSFDATYEGKANGIEFPWFLYYLVHYIFSRKHKGSWRFLPCTFWGQPRALAFGPAPATVEE